MNSLNCYYAELQNIFEHKAIVEDRYPMEKYLLNQFSFAGIKAPLRKEIQKPIIKNLCATNAIDWEFVNDCFNGPYREAVYVACDYLRKVSHLLTQNDLKLLKQLIKTNSWWESVDSLVFSVGAIIERYPECKDQMIIWSKEDDIWIRRSAILHQLYVKENYDFEILQLIIANNIGTNEFFINKAIGWALRQYSKQEPEIVIKFVEENNSLSSLSKAEALKYINKNKRPS